MLYKIKYSAEALSDIRQIGLDVFEVSKSKDITRNYLNDFFDSVEKKQLFPESGIRLYFNDYFTGFYFVHFKAYNAFYRIVGDRVEIVRVLSSKSDYIRVLLGDYFEEDIQSSNENDYLNESGNE